MIAVDACADADDAADLVWSLLNGYHFETHWNDLLIVRCDFGGNFDVVVAGAGGAVVAFDPTGCDPDCSIVDVDVVEHCSHSCALAFGVHNAVTERPDC